MRSDRQLIIDALNNEAAYLHIHATDNDELAEAARCRHLAATTPYIKQATP